MVKFNELQILPNGQLMVIDVSVLDLPYYDNVYISEILIDTQDTYIDKLPSKEAINVYSATENVKNARVELKNPLFVPSLEDNLFFVYVKVKGTPSADTPCGMDNEYTLGVTLYNCPLYNSFMANVKELNKECSVPKRFIDDYLKFKAFQLSIETGHYTEAISFYNKFFKNIRVFTSTKCNCHG